MDDLCSNWMSIYCTTFEWPVDKLIDLSNGWWSCWRAGWPRLLTEGPCGTSGWPFELAIRSNQIPNDSGIPAWPTKGLFLCGQTVLLLIVDLLFKKPGLQDILISNLHKFNNLYRYPVYFVYWQLKWQIPKLPTGQKKFVKPCTTVYKVVLQQADNSL